MHFGIGSLIFLTALFAILFRWLQVPSTTEISFSDLEFDTRGTSSAVVSKVPETIALLDDRPVRISGYISPHSIFQAKGIRKFILTRDAQEPETRSCDFVVVRMAENASIDFTTRPITVAGVFHLLTPPISHNKTTFYYEIQAAEAGPYISNP